MTAVMEETRPVSVTAEDGSRTYTYPPTGEDLWSVTTIIGGTDSKPHIRKWYASQSAKWCIDNIDRLARVLAEEGRDAAVKLAAAEAERQRNLKSEAGVYVHDVQQALILWAASPGRTGADIALPTLPDHLQNAVYDLGGGKSAPLPEVVEWMVDGFLNFVSDFSPRFEASEMTVYNRELGYAGTLDHIMVLDGYAISAGTGPHGWDEAVPRPGGVLRLCGDTKTGKEPEGTWKEQLPPYRRATECLLPLGQLHPMPPTDAGVVLHLRPDYPGGYCLMLVSAGEDEAAWERFLKAASIFTERQEVKGKPGLAIRPLLADGTMRGVRLGDLAGEGYGRALAPLRKALGAAAELEDVARFTEADILEVKGVGPKLIGVIKGMLADYGLALAGGAPAIAEAA